MGARRLALENDFTGMRGNRGQQRYQNKRSANHIEILRREDRLRELGDERADHHEKENPDKAAPFGNGEAGADGGAESMAERQLSMVDRALRRAMPEEVRRSRDYETSSDGALDPPKAGLAATAMHFRSPKQNSS